MYGDDQEDNYHYAPKTKGKSLGEEGKEPLQRTEIRPLISGESRPAARKYRNSNTRWWTHVLLGGGKEGPSEGQGKEFLPGSLPSAENNFRDQMVKRGINGIDT